MQLIKDERIDTVSLQYVPHGFQSKGLPFSLIFLMKQLKHANVKIMIFFHEVCISFDEKRTLKRLILYMGTVYIAKRLLNQADSIATSIEYYQHLIQKFAPQKEISTPIPIASNIPSSNINKKELTLLRDKIAPQGEIIISFFGQRNTSTSILALHKLIKEGKAIKILFIGKTKNDTTTLDEKDYYTTGLLDSNEIDSYLRLSDILILPEPSHSGCSFKNGSLIAALKDGIPVLSSNGRMTSPKLKNMFNICFVNFENTSDIENKLRHLINNPSTRENIGNQAQLTVQNITWENTYNEYMRILSKP